MTQRVQFRPTEAKFDGGRIGLAGDTIWVYCRRITPRFKQNVVKVDRVNGTLLFFADRDVMGTVRVEGVYENIGGHAANTLWAMSREGPITGATVSLDNGVEFKGDLVLMGSDFMADVDKDKIPVSLDFHFSGRISGDGMESGMEEESGDSGTIYTNLKEVTGLPKMTYSKSYSDQREDYATEPFVIVGITEGSGVPLSLAEQRVVAAMGGADHTWLGDSTLPFSRVSGIRYLGVNLVGGALVYDRNGIDCRAYQYRSDVGFLVRGKELSYVTGDSGSDPEDVCTALATGAFSARLPRWMDRVQTYVIHLLPCVFDSPPESDENLTAMINTINNASVTIKGVARDAYTLWFAGVAGVREFVRPSGSKYFGYLQINELQDGWTDGKLTCAQTVPFDLENNTAPGYTVRSSVKQLYQYDRATWQTIAQLCPNCYG